jgi:hypothetical protein
VRRIWARSKPSGLVFFSPSPELNVFRIIAFWFSSELRLLQKSAPGGTFFGMGRLIPARASTTEVSPEDLKPFSLASTVMIDEQTQQRYEVLDPIASPGKKYLPSGLANVLLPGEARTLSIQFASPPMPPLIQGQERRISKR